LKQAFTMMELIFVIVIIGILVSVAVPKLSVTREDAVTLKMKTTISTLRTAIAVEEQARLLRGDFSEINASQAVALLAYGLDSDWSIEGEDFIYTSPQHQPCIFTIIKNRFVYKENQACDIAGLATL